jgi:predicted transcriptional regulator
MKIARIRKEKNLTQADLALSCETSQQQIAKIEGGIVDPRLSTIRRIAEALDCDLPELFYSRKEFLSEIIAVIQNNKIDLKKIKLVQLNSLCASEKGIPAFDPLWEEIQIAKGSVSFKEK